MLRSSIVRSLRSATPLVPSSTGRFSSSSICSSRRLATLRGNHDSCSVGRSHPWEMKTPDSGKLFLRDALLVVVSSCLMFQYKKSEVLNASFERLKEAKRQEEKAEKQLEALFAELAVR